MNTIGLIFSYAIAVFAAILPLVIFAMIIIAAGLIPLWIVMLIDDWLLPSGIHRAEDTTI